MNHFVQNIPLINKPKFRFQASCIVLFERGFIVDEVKESYLNLNDAFVTFKKRPYALEDLDEIDIASEFNAAVENSELGGSVWVYTRIASMNFDLHKDVIKGGSDYVGLPITYLSLLNIQNNNDNLYGIWCIIARLHLVKVNACRTNGYEKIQYNNY